MDAKRSRSRLLNFPQFSLPAAALALSIATAVAEQPDGRENCLMQCAEKSCRARSKAGGQSEYFSDCTSNLVCDGSSCKARDEATSGRGSSAPEVTGPVPVDAANGTSAVETPEPSEEGYGGKLHAIASGARFVGALTRMLPVIVARRFSCGRALVERDAERRET